jgi:hypothetical protein
MDDLATTLKCAFGIEKPVLVECPIDCSENIDVWNKELDSIECYLL